MPTRTPVAQSSAHVGLETALPVIESSTTSRVVVDNEVLRIVQFAFDAGEALTEHSSPRAVSCLLSTGRMTFTVEGHDHDMGPGDVVYLAPGAPHALTAHEPSRLTLTMVDVDALAGRHG